MSDGYYPFQADVPCELCGKIGSWDIMGDDLCSECLEKCIQETNAEEYND